MYTNTLCVNYKFVLVFSDVSVHLIEYSLQLARVEKQCSITIPDD